MYENSRYTGTSTVQHDSVSVVENALPAGYELRNPNSGSRYRILGKLGQGGFGITYKAAGPNGTVVALKEFFPASIASRTQTMSVSVLGDSGRFQRMLNSFYKEASVLNALKGLSAVVTIYDYFYANGTAYYVMEYVQGETLEKHMKNNGLLDPSTWLRQYRFLMQDLEQVHAKGVIHRDIAPDNIIILPGGRFKLIDFGSARSYAGGENLTVHLKPSFAPVEQNSPTGQGTYTDVYSLAATMYYSFSGKLPPPAVSRMANDTFVPLAQHNPRISPTQDQAISKALAVKAENRYQSMHEFEAAFFSTAPVKPVSSGGDKLGGISEKLKSSAALLMADPLFPALGAVFFAAALLFQLIL